MTQELRIRDSYAGPGGRARYGDPVDPDRREEPPTDPGETAWDLPPPALGLTRESAEPEARREARDERPMPFPGFPGMGGEEKEPPKGPGLNLERLARGILKRGWLAAGIALGIASLFLMVAVTLVKPKWQASAAVILHSRQDQFSLGSAKPFELQTYNLKTLLDTIKLPSALQAVADTLKLETTSRALSAAIGANVGKDSSIFQVTAVWKDPAVAAHIANTVAELLVQRSRDLRRNDAADAYANYSDQLEAARAQQRAVNAELRTFKADHQVSDLHTETQVLLGSLSLQEADFNTKIAEAQAKKEVLADVAQAVKGQPEMVVTSSVYRNPLKTRLSDYEWQLQDARSRYTEQNPKVIKLQSRVDMLKQMIAESKDEGAPENLYSANTKLKDLQALQRELTNDIRVREAQTAALAQTIEQNRTKLAALTAADKDFQALEARLAAADALVAGLVGRADEAEVMMQRNEAAFDLFEAARPPTEPMPSPKKLIAIAGVVLGGGFGLAVVLALELLDPMLRTRRDATDIPGIPFVGEFQQVPAGEHAVVDGRRPADPIADLFRRLINELDAKLEPEDWRCLGVTSADAAVGRTLIATNLAQTLALKEHPAILVDADLRGMAGTRPAELLGLRPDQPGLLQALRGDTPAASLLTAAGTPDLALLAAGCDRPELTLEPRDAGLDGDLDPGSDQHLARLGTRQFRAILDSLQQTGRHLVYDLPPIGAQETVLEAAAALGNLLLVARSGRTTRTQLREAVERLEERGAKVQAILVTDVPVELLEDRPLFYRQPQTKARRHWFRRSAPQAPAPAAPDPRREPHVS